MKVSVVIPIGKDNPYLPKVIDSIEMQTIKSEIILESRGGIGLARKLGVERATGDIIAFIDSDCVLPNERWMANMLLPFINDKEVVLTHTSGIFHDDDPAVMRYSILSQPYNPDVIPGTGATLISKEAILKAGNFEDVPGSEDKLLIHKLKGKCVYLPLGVYHYHATTIRQFLWKQWRCKCLCDYVADKYNIEYLAYKDEEAKNHRSNVIKYNNKHFLRALIGKEDSAWLLWPLIGFCQLMIYRVISKVIKY